ncbi:MAG: (Fe-S)-binding protein [Geminicoccaceae bacterium]|nr:(Fe-S)-binding protein [Geminicoccaceae bacterium]
MPASSPRVALFVTCLVDLFRPSVGFAAVRLLEAAGCVVEVPEAQTCCGQPAFNSGDRATTEALAKGLIPAFEGYDYVVAPSGSCAGMLSKHLPELFEGDPSWRARAEDLAARCHELVSFLVDVRGMTGVPGDLAAKVTYHDSCAGLREMKVKAQPRRLLAAMPGIDLVEMAESELCCGFGGTFCVKYPTISTQMVDRKADDVAASGADLLLAGDMGCLMNMAGRLKRRGVKVEARHVAEVLAGMTDGAPIGGR